MARWFDKEVKDINSRIENIIGEIKTIQSELEVIEDTAEDKYDNYPENLQDSETGERMYARIDVFSDQAQELDDVAGALQDISNELENIE